MTSKAHKKLKALVKEVIKRVYPKDSKKEQIAKSVDRLLSLPPAPVPENYNEWEREYSELKQK